MPILAAALFAFADPVWMDKWQEWTPPGAAFQIDVPDVLTAKPDVAIARGTVNRSWQTFTGRLSILVQVDDRDHEPFGSVQETMEALGRKFTETRKNPTHAVTAMTLLGRPAAKLVFEYDLDNGIRYHGEELMIRFGQDDWSIYTGHDKAEAWAANAEAHIYASVQAPVPAATLAPTKIGRMTVSAPGKPVIGQQALEGEWAKYFGSWTVYAFDDQKGSKIWISHYRLLPGKTVDPDAIAGFFADSVKEQSQNKPNLYRVDVPVAGRTGRAGSAVARYPAGPQDARVMAVADGQDVWAMLAGGPNNAHTETLFRRVVASMTIAP